MIALLSFVYGIVVCISGLAMISFAIAFLHEGRLLLGNLFMALAIVMIIGGTIGFIWAIS